MKATARIWNSHDYQDVCIEYSGSGQHKFIVDSLKIVTPLEVKPSDLYTDLCYAIENDQDVEMVRIECEIETKDPKPSKFSFLHEEQEHLFIGGVPNY